MNDFEIIIRDPKEFGDRLLELKNEKMFCDAEIVFRTERIAVHRHILASSSEYFEKIFTENVSILELTMKNMDLETVQLILDYCYSGIIRILVKNLDRTIFLAKFLKITLIVERYEKVLEQKMVSLNCISTWKLAQSENFENLKNIAFEYARQNFEKVSQSQEFLNLNYSEIEELLGSDIIVANEMIVYKTVMRWLNHDNELRRPHLDELSHYIRFEYLPKNILVSELRLFCRNNSSNECLSKIIKALQWKDDKKLFPYDENLRDSYDVNTLMVVGLNQTRKSVEIFDLKNEKWIKIENLEINISNFIAVSLGYKLMLIGEQIGRSVNKVLIYDLRTGAMENLSPLKYARRRLVAVEFKGCVYAIGGINKTVLTYIEMYDSISKTWKEVAPMSIPRYRCVAAVLDQEVYVVGGTNDQLVFSEMESYNPVTNKWTTRASMNMKRYSHGGAVVGGYLYVAGGFSSDHVFLMTAERYDSTTNTWTMIQQMGIAYNLMGAAKFFGKFVIIGGRRNVSDEFLTIMEMYNDENNTWNSMPSLNEPQISLNAIEIPWKLAKALLSREVPK